MFIIVMFVSYFVISGMKFVEKMLKNSVDLDYLLFLCMYLASRYLLGLMYLFVLNLCSR